METNAPLLLEWAAAVFGHWGEPSPEAGNDLRLRLMVHDLPETLPETPVPILRVQEGVFVVTAGQSFGLSDRPAGTGFAFLTPALLERPAQAQSWFMESLGLYLVCGRRTATLHAAGVAWKGRGILLTGPDGAGKTTLAYACLRAGFQLLTEDMAYAEPSVDGVRVWGDSRTLNLLPDAVRFFPELKSAPYVTQLNGETKLRVSVRETRPGAALTQMPVWGVCTLARSCEPETRLLPVDPTYLRYSLTHFKGDPPIDTTAMDAAVDALLTTRLAHCEVGSDLNHAVAMLKQWLEQA